MPEVAYSGVQHGETGFVGGGDDFVVADRAAGLDDGRGAGFRGGDQSVGEGEVGVGGDDGALGQAFAQE